MSLLDAAADLLLGASCPCCRRPGGFGPCRECAAALDQPAHRIDRGVGVPLVAAAPYRPLLEHAIPHYKDDGALHLDRWLGKLLARSVADLDPPRSTVLVPMPSLPAATRRRGYDHARRLAHVAAKTCGLRAVALLRRTRGGADQRGLTKGQRTRNLDGALIARSIASPVIIVDDVATTGASLREAERALRQAGVSVIGAAVIAEADNQPRQLWSFPTGAWAER
ncbi:MAG TPA: ComF family protein [Tessaracoccus flavescens]|uniref:ComF family protein n=1 Tax=Tessaracoccus flavescens TaxID=399497 RepID=A0A921JS53_9ACTN|nr:ComF family protein [Tessaracoccus flavescens]